MRVLNLTDQQPRYVRERTDLYQEKEKNNIERALIKTPNCHWGILFLQLFYSVNTSIIQEHR